MSGITKVGHHLPDGAVTGRIAEYGDDLAGGYVVLDDSVTVHVRTALQADAVAQLFLGLAYRLRGVEADAEWRAAGVAITAVTMAPHPADVWAEEHPEPAHPWPIGTRIMLARDYDGIGYVIGTTGLITKVYAWPDGGASDNRTGYSYDVDVDGEDNEYYVYGSEVKHVADPPEPLTSAEAELLAAVDVHGEYGVGSILRVVESGRVGTVEAVTDARGEAAYRLSFGCGSRHEWYAHHEVAPEMINEETH